MKLSTTTKVLLVVLLLVVAVAVWYMLFIQGTRGGEVATGPAPEQTQAAPAEAQAQQPQEAAKPSEEEAKQVTSTSARALEVLPLPFLVTEAPKEEAATTEKEEAKTEEGVGPIAKVTTPPNPFLPLPKQRREILAKQREEEAKPVEETEKPVVVKPQPTEPELVEVPVPKLKLPQAGEPVLPPEAKLTLGALPIRLQPVEREVVPAAMATGEEEAQGKQVSAGKANPLEEWAKKIGLKLSGVALGPVSVAIFQTNSGYVALSVGETFPGTDVVLKAITAERVLLVQGQNSLTLEYGGGE